MYIVELYYPGTWLKFDNEEEKRNISSLINQLETQIIDASINLSLFESSKQHRNQFSKDDWEKNNQRRQQLLEKYTNELQSSSFDYANYNRLNTFVDIELKHENWSKGELPRSYTHRFPFIHAKSFLYNLDTIGNIIKVLSKIKDVPKQVLKAEDLFTLSFPNLRKVRNSSQHIEDRGRSLGSGRNPKPLQLKPINNSFISADGGALMLENLMGNCFGSTMDNGEYGEVEISYSSLMVATKCTQVIINSFNWDGPPEHHPY